MKKRPPLPRRHYETVTLLLGAIIASSSDAVTKTRLDKALKAFRKSCRP